MSGFITLRNNSSLISHIFFRHISSFYLCHAYTFCLLRIFFQPLSPLYPITFLRLDIQSNFLFLIPKVFHRSGYPCYFLLLYTQRFSLFWVSIRLFASLYPKVFSLLGIHTAFSFSIPKVFLSSGYPYAFFFLYTQSFFLPWVYIWLLYLVCPNFYIHLRIMDTFPFTAPFLCPFMLWLLLSHHRSFLPCDIVLNRAVTEPVSYPQ